MCDNLIMKYEIETTIFLTNGLKKLRMCVFAPESPYVSTISGWVCLETVKALGKDFLNCVFSLGLVSGCITPSKTDGLFFFWLEAINPARKGIEKARAIMSAMEG